jgi:hypothetical protein
MRGLIALAGGNTPALCPDGAEPLTKPPARLVAKAESAPGRAAVRQPETSR